MENMYECITDTKKKSLGQTMTVADACKLLWNSVRVYGTEGIAYYNPKNNEFTVDNCETPDDFLKMEITLDDYWQEDADGYPIIYGSKVDD